MFSLKVLKRGKMITEKGGSRAGSRSSGYLKWHFRRENKTGTPC